MRLRNIRLENYRRFGWAELEFPDGIVGVIGNNGAGKSTLMEAIAWALFGTDASRTSKDQIKSIFARKADVCRVILDFEMNGDNFQVVRELKGASNAVDASVIVNKKVAARGNNAVNDLVQKTLDMDYRAFMTSFYAKQRELNALSDYQPHKRKELLARMLGIETVDQALRNLRSDKREMELKLDFNRSRLVDKDGLRLREKEKSENVVVLKDSFRMTKEKLESRSSRLKEAENLWKALKAKYEEYVGLRQKASVMESQRESLAGQLRSQEEEKETLAELESEKMKLQNLLVPYEDVKERVSLLDKEKAKAEHSRATESQIQEIESSLTADTTRLERLNAELKSQDATEDDLKRVRAKLDSAEKELEEQRKLYVRLEASFQSGRDEKSRLDAQLRNVEKLGPDSVCDRCLRPMGADYDKVREHLLDEQSRLEEKLRPLEQRREEIKRKGQDVKSTRSELTEQRDKLQKSLEEFSKLQGQRQNLEISIKEKERMLASLREVLKKLGAVKYDSSLYIRLKEELERLESLRQKSTEVASELKRLPQVQKKIEELRQKVDSARREGKKLQEAVLALRFSEEEYRAAESDLEQKRKELHATELALKDVQHQLEIGQKEINQIKREIEDTVKLEQEIKGWQTEQRYLEKLDLLFSEFRVSLIGRIRPTLSRYARDLFLELSENRYEDLELDEDYEIYIYDRGERFPMNRFSGGETDLANLCLRIAISLLICESSQVRFSFIILDEIFGSQDLLRKENILNALAKLKNRFAQIFLITHIDDIKDSVENLVYVAENEDGTSDLVLE
jgi:exonuclease SbcC